MRGNHLNVTVENEVSTGAHFCVVFTIVCVKNKIFFHKNIAFGILLSISILLLLKYSKTLLYVLSFNESCILENLQVQILFFVH